MSNIIDADRNNFVEWDTVNWSKLIDVIESSGIDLQGKKVLELGARNGGLSLYYALNGAEVLCSDVTKDFPSQRAIHLHEKYHLQDRITYAQIDALNIPEKYHGKFDVVTFKSILGGIGSHDTELESIAVRNIAQCLKPGGYAIFAENMKSSSLHQFFRRTRKYSWHYQTEENILSLFGEKFSLVEKCYCGFLGCFGVTEGMREVLGYLDRYIFDRVVPERWKYVGIFIFKLRE